MSRTLARYLNSFGRTLQVCTNSKRHLLTTNSMRMKNLLQLPQSSSWFSVSAYSRKVGWNHNWKSLLRAATKTRHTGNCNELNILKDRRNWEITFEENYDFYLPNGIGPAWLDDAITEKNIRDLVDFGGEPNADANLLEMSMCTCPLVLHDKLSDLFPAATLLHNPLTLLMLHKENGDLKVGMTKICYHLLSAGYFANFFDPFTGQPYLLPEEKFDAVDALKECFHVTNLRFAQINGCIIISREERADLCFAGMVVTNAPCDINAILSLLKLHDMMEVDN